MTEPIDRAAIKARAEAATAGPWSYRPEILGLPNTTVMAGNGQVGYVAVGHFLSPDAEFIAHAREDIPALLAALEEAERETSEVWKLVSKLSRERNEAERRLAAVASEAEAIRADYIAFWGAHSSSDIERVGRSPRMPKTPALDRERAALHPVAETTEKGNDE